MAQRFKTKGQFDSGLSVPPALSLATAVLLGGDVSLWRAAAKRLMMDGSLYLGDAASTVAQLLVLGGASGGPMVTLQRTSGSPSQFSWALGGGGLSFSDDTAGFIVVNLFGSGSINAMYLGQSGRTVAATRPSLLSAETFSTAAGADIPANALRLQGGLGVGTSAPGDIEFYTGNAALTTVAQSAVLRAVIKALTGQLQLPGQGVAAGILIGGDVNLYRSAANILATDDPMQVRPGVTLGGTQDVMALAPGAAITDGVYASMAGRARFGHLNGSVMVTDNGTGKTFRLELGAAGALVMSMNTTGQMALPAQGSAGGLLIGGDVNLYRSLANVLKTDDALEVVGALTNGGVAVVLANDSKLVVDGPSFNATVRTLDTVPNSAMPGDSTLDSIAGSNDTAASVYLANQRIVSLANPTAAQDAATKAYVDLNAKEVNVSPAGPTPRVGELLWVDTDEAIATYGPPLFVTSLPSTPYNGQEVYYNYAAQGVTWHLRYNATAGYWDFLGGAPLYIELGSQGGTVTTHTTYQDLSGTGPGLSIPLKGSYDVAFGCLLTTAILAANIALVSIDMSACGGAAAQDSAAASLTTPAAAATAASVYRFFNTGYLSTIGAIRMNYRSSTANQIFASRRSLAITPRYVL